jgi:hypothetical protein
MRVGDPDQLRVDLLKVLSEFKVPLETAGLRDQVRALVPGNHLMRDLGGSLLPQGSGSSAPQRILSYLRTFPGEIIDGDELMVVAGISEYARRIRELRVEQGWPILSGVAARDQRRDAEDQGALQARHGNPFDDLLAERSTPLKDKRNRLLFGVPT